MFYLLVIYWIAIVTIGAHSTPKSPLEYDDSVSIRKNKNMTGYGPAHLIRFKNIDKNKRGSSKKIPEKKGDVYPPPGFGL